MAVLALPFLAAAGVALFAAYWMTTPAYQKATGDLANAIGEGVDNAVKNVSGTIKGVSKEVDQAQTCSTQDCGDPQEPDKCKELRQIIKDSINGWTDKAGNYQKGLMQRFTEQMHGDYGPGMLYNGKDSWAGHETQMKGLQNRIKNAVEDMKKLGCRQPPQVDVEWGTKSLPTWLGPR